LSPSEGQALVASVLRSLGLESFALMSREALPALTVPPDRRDAYGLDLASGVAVALLPYDPRPPTTCDILDSEGLGDEGPLAVVGAFAAYNRYAALARLLKEAAACLAKEAGLPRRSFRVMVNSRLPEKPLAAMAGLGRIGRSGLFISEAYGPACVIGVLILPGALSLPSGLGSREGGTVARSEACDNCQACAAACPNGAIGPDGPVVRLCAQYWASRPGELPPVVEAGWGRRLYGCDACVAACPVSTRAYRSVDGSSPAQRAEALFLPSEKRPGRLVSARRIIDASDEELRNLFKKTALGFSWIAPAALRRNASLAITEHGRGSLSASP